MIKNLKKVTQKDIRIAKKRKLKAILEERFVHEHPNKKSREDIQALKEEEKVHGIDQIASKKRRKLSIEDINDTSKQEESQDESEEEQVNNLEPLKKKPRSNQLIPVTEVQAITSIPVVIDQSEIVRAPIATSTTASSKKTGLQKPNGGDTRISFKETKRTEQNLPIKAQTRAKVTRAPVIDVKLTPRSHIPTRRESRYLTYAILFVTSLILLMFSIMLINGRTFESPVGYQYMKIGGGRELGYSYEDSKQHEMIVDKIRDSNSLPPKLYKRVQAIPKTDLEILLGIKGNEVFENYLKFRMRRYAEQFARQVANQMKKIIAGVDKKQDTEEDIQKRKENDRSTSDDILSEL